MKLTGRSIRVGTMSEPSERPAWLHEGALIHVVNVIPVSVRCVSNIFGYTGENRFDFHWTQIGSGEERQGVSIKSNEPMPKDWRVVNEMEAIALQAMDRDEYLVWMKEWYRKQKERVHGDGAEV